MVEAQPQGRPEGATGEAGHPGYDPGWSDATWVGAEPEALPKPGPLRAVLGVFRIIVFTLTTLLLLPLFFIARATGGRRDRIVAGWWCGSGVRLAGLKIRKIGAPMETGGALLVNHASWLDIMAIGSLAPVHFVAKAEIEGWPIFGWIGRISNTVFIARRRAEAKEQEKLLARRAAEGDLLCLFPEGTSSDGLRVLPFKSSLFSLFFSAPNEEGAPSLRGQPVSIHFAPRDGLPASFFGWWGRMPLFGHIWSVCSMGGGVVTVEFHEPLDPSAFANRKALAAEAERMVRFGRDRAEKAWRGEAAAETADA